MKKKIWHSKYWPVSLNITIGSITGFSPFVLEKYSVAAAVFFAIALVALLVFVNWLFIERERAKGRTKTIQGSDLDMYPRDGIIFTLSDKSHDPESPVRKVMEKLKPRYVAFLSTERTIEAKAAKTLIKDLELAPERVKQKTVEAFNYNDIFDAAQECLKWMKEEKNVDNRLISMDITGGTAVASVAAFVAAKINGVDAQYISSKYDKHGNPISGTQEILVVK